MQLYDRSAHTVAPIRYRPCAPMPLNCRSRPRGPFAHATPKVGDFGRSRSNFGTKPGTVWANFGPMLSTEFGEHRSKLVNCERRLVETRLKFGKSWPTIGPTRPKTGVKTGREVVNNQPNSAELAQCGTTQSDRLRGCERRLSGICFCPALTRVSLFGLYDGAADSFHARDEFQNAGGVPARIPKSLAQSRM